MSTVPAAIRIGTRGSPLALVQAGQVARLLQDATGARCELVPVMTHGDVSRASLAALGSVGVFASVLREGLLAGKFDCAVHSFKDLPAVQPDGLAIAAIPPRADQRDVLCARDRLTLAQLPVGARIGTGSPRRAAQLTRLRADVRVIDLRGNVGSRLQRVSAGELDGVLLAAAGLARLDLEQAISERFTLADWPTAPAQGAIAVETLATRSALVAAIDVPAARLSACAERAVLAGLQAGCAAPVAASARLQDGVLELHVKLYDREAAGDLELTLDRAGVHDQLLAEQLGRDAAAELLARGAGAIVARAKGAARR